MTHNQPGGHYEEPTIGKLIADASRDISSLVQGEIALAKSELRASVRAGGMGAGFIAAAAFRVLLAIVMLSISFALFLTMTGLDAAWSFLIVFGAYVLIAAIFVFAGRRKLRKVGPPTATIDEANKTKQILSRG
jgi:LPXTG-motif cell wall-anchored protein